MCGFRTTVRLFVHTAQLAPLAYASANIENQNDTDDEQCGVHVCSLHLSPVNCTFENQQCVGQLAAAI
jgi:hypothetical protein